MLCEPSVQPLSSGSNVLLILKLQRGHEGGGICYIWVAPQSLSLPLMAASSIGVYFHIQANMSHLHVCVHHATCAAGIHATSSGLESLELTSSFPPLQAKHFLNSKL